MHRLVTGMSWPHTILLPAERKKYENHGNRDVFVVFYLGQTHQMFTWFDVVLIA